MSFVFAKLFSSTF